MAKETIEQQFVAKARSLTDEQAFRLLPGVKAWVATMEKYTARGREGPTPKLHIGSKSYGKSD